MTMTRMSFRRVGLESSRANYGSLLGDPRGWGRAGTMREPTIIEDR